MASSKHYAYYIRGSQLAIVEHDSSSGDGLNYSGADINDIGPSGGLQWKSPIASITDGLEIEYAYSPRYQVLSNTTIDVNKFYVLGWTVINGYLTFLRNKDNSLASWLTTPESAVTSGSSGDTGGQSLDYIVVGGSSRWNGLHRVQTASDKGRLITYTKVNNEDAYWENQQVDFNTDEEIFDGGAGTLFLADHFTTNDYVFITGSGTGQNNGMFSISSISTSTTAASSKLTLGTRYAIVVSSDTQSGPTGLSNEYSAAASLTGETDQSDISIYKAYRDFSYVLTDVNVLNDESDTIDLPEYLAKALVYYVKAKVAEDQGDIEQKEYNMREFRRILEKHESSKIWGARQLGVGPHGIR